VAELLGRVQKNSVANTAAILRNQLGLKDQDIGLGNEKSINQLIAHHAVIFQPEKGLAWVSTAPWQLGKFVCYDLNRIFKSRLSDNEEIYEKEKTIPLDSFLYSNAYVDCVKFNKYRFPFNERIDLAPDSIVKWNPNSYHAYMLAADYCRAHENWEKAVTLYETGLTKEIATEQERAYMQMNLQHCKEKLK